MAVHTQQIPGGELILRFEGEFAAPDAWRLHEVVGAAPALATVVLDFTQVRHFEDFAVALMAPDLVATSGLRIRVRGLGLHQQRILEYFGVRGLGAEPRHTPVPGELRA